MFDKAKNSFGQGLPKNQSRIKSLLLYHQIHVPSDMETPKWPIKFLDWLKELSFENGNTKFTLDSMLNQYRFIDAEIKSVSNMIRAYCKKHYKIDYNLLRSIPGIAGLTAAYILTELGDLRRFTSFKKFASYVGFVPGVQQSGDNIQYRCIPTSKQTCEKHDCRSGMDFN